MIYCFKAYLNFKEFTKVSNKEVTMSIGYASKVIGQKNMSIKGCKLNYATEERLQTLIEHNLSSLERILEYNQKNAIHLFRISSDIIPFGSSIASRFPWKELFMDKLSDIGEKAGQYGIRLSMHPGQYTLINSKDSTVIKRSIEDLRYHTNFLDSLGLDSTQKIILHIGGVYGDKKTALARFAEQYLDLDSAIKRRLVIENDDKSYHIGDVLELATKLSIPVVYDTLHNEVNCCDLSKNDYYWISQCKSTWQETDGKQKVHYSQQDKLKKAGSHSKTIEIYEFMKFYSELSENKPDIMLEVKDKNLSAIKCIHCIDSNRTIKALEEEWSRYKYLVLEKAPNDYKKIRELLKDKRAYPVLAFYHLIEHALFQDAPLGSSLNAAFHVWSYFKGVASLKEKEKFLKLVQQCKNDASEVSKLKRYLYQLSKIYQKDYLLQSYYFIM